MYETFKKLVQVRIIARTTLIFLRMLAYSRNVQLHFLHV